MNLELMRHDAGHGVSYLQKLAISTAFIDLLISSYSVHFVTLEPVLLGDENTTRKTLAVNRYVGWWLNLVNKRILGKDYHKRVEDQVSGWVVKVPTAGGVRYHALLGFDRSIEIPKATKLMQSQWAKAAPEGSFSSTPVASLDELSRCCSPEFWTAFVNNDAESVGFFALA